MSSVDESNTNYVAYRDLNALGQPRIGSLDLTNSLIQPLAFASGHPISSLYQVIEVGTSEIKPSGDKISLSKVQLLPPISGRDVLAVGKNYSEHAKEFNSSGFDSSDKVDIPSHPVIFTKRATSIIASGESILPHPDFTQSADYEGEIGVIIGKAGFRVEEKDAMDYVWGYTIINDVTARERQRDHKQFFIGKSPDTFCPMGPIAVPASKLPSVLRVQTSVNGEERQNATTEDLIFSIPFLIKTISEGQTILPGDVIATGTPAGVGIGKKPPVYLKPGDVIEVSVTGLGTLKNSVSENTAKNQTQDRESQSSSIPTSNLDKTCGGAGLTDINSKKLYYIQQGIPSGPPIIFIHGLGASSEYYSPLITTLSLSEKYSLHLLDLEGHGLSPTSATSVISISSYASDFAALAQKSSIEGATVIAHSMGCAIALKLATQHPEVVSKLILLGPPTQPFPEAAGTFLTARAVVVRNSGMAAIVDTITTRAISAKTKSENLLAVAAIRMSLLGTDPEGYAKGCTALAGATDILPLKDIKASTLIVTGDEDTVCPPETYEKLVSEIQGAKVEVLKNVGHWHVLEDLKSVAEAVKAFL